MTLVSVIVPMWNDASYIIECLNSIDTTDDMIGEVIVIDNASTDNSVSLVTLANIPKVKIVRNSANVGAARARHQAIALSSYPLITFLDSDDILGPNAVRDAASDLVNRQLDISIYTMLRLDSSGKTHFYIPPLTEVISGNEAFGRTIGGWAIHPMGVFKREVYDTATNDFDFHGHSDDEVITRYIFLSAAQVGGNQGVYLYRDRTREYTAQQILGQALTNMRTLRLAIQHGVAVNKLRIARNNIILNLLAIVKRGIPFAKDKPVILDIAKSVVALDIPWHILDMPYRVAIYLLRPFLSLRHGRHR
ncbi:glycosyl transferase family 2 [Sphingomonas sp. PP-F2F-G114-C0414]|uniref:glycosyltransferase family 2 protein n=1 Tax=Sphingomonas sp. PP-F2F-G114-C0414 TaxID=2135662 RepID=UPI000EF88F7E|nr:glycosyltransferase family 2 protein [Sphingomonas sp. PP-F2F-G114-C0414]RMB25694.1 glycosyl transferase family 2 [Sphingomonas sp. PP-F2F-G114-C0414]